MIQTQDLKELYEKWNKNSLTFTEEDDFIEITTPFVDMHHDYIQLYFTQEGNGLFKLTDDGYIINELYMLGVDIKTTTKRKEFFHRTLKIFGINIDAATNELWVTFDNIEDYPKKQNNLIQCILRVSDMLLTAKNTVISIFTEEISNFFYSNDVVYVEDTGFIGKTGNQINFDFVLPRFKKKKEQLIKAVNTPTADNYSLSLLSFLDIREAGSRDDAEFIVLANDANAQIADKFRTSLQNYGIEVLAWSKRKEWIDKLKIS